jgi:hypothetical protein
MGLTPDQTYDALRELQLEHSRLASALQHVRQQRDVLAVHAEVMASLGLLGAPALQARKELRRMYGPKGLAGIKKEARRWIQGRMPTVSW